MKILIMTISFQKILRLHDFPGKQKQNKVLLFKDNFCDNSDDLKNANIPKIQIMILIL